jgi:hypothetical protein
MKSLYKLLLGLVLIVFANQASALTDAYFENDSNTTVYIKFTLLYPDEFRCKFAFSAVEDNTHNLTLPPYLHPVVGPFPNDCHVAISASLDNKHFTTCKKGENVVEGYSANIKVNGSTVNCEISPWNSAKSV